MTERTLAEGERIRIAHVIERHRAVLASVELSLGLPDGPAHDAVQAFAHSAADVTCALARLEAFLRAEGAQR